MVCPCHNCKKRYLKKNPQTGEVISSCHSECELYKAYDEENKRIRALRYKKSQEVSDIIDSIQRMRTKRR